MKRVSKHSRQAILVLEETHNGATSERSEILKRGSFRGSGSNDDAVFHRVVLLQGFDELGDGRALLTDGDVDTIKLLSLIVAIVPSSLVQHSVECDSSLSGLTITNDQLTLTTTNRDHGVDGFETGLYRLVDRSSRKNTRSLDLSTGAPRGLDRAFAIDRVSESIDDTTKHSLADWDIDLGGVSSL